MPRRPPPPGPAASAESPVYFTTFQAAQLLGVSLPTVVNWVKAERLRAHRTAGGHRRIAREELVRFAREGGMPLPAELEGPPSGAWRVLVVDADRSFAELVKDYLALKGRMEVQLADTGFAAGLAVGRFKPQLVLLDLMMPDLDAFEALDRLHEGSEGAAPAVIACLPLGDSALEGRAREAAFAGVVHKPLRLEELLSLMEGALGHPL